MKLPRRKFLHLAAGAAVPPVVSRIAHAQGYPSRPVRILVGFAAGGNFDIVARLIGQWLSEQLQQTVMVENRPGASSNLATEAAIRAPADGYTLLLGVAVNAVNATLYEKLFVSLPEGTPSEAYEKLAYNVRTRAFFGALRRGLLNNDELEKASADLEGWLERDQKKFAEEQKREAGKAKRS